MDPEQPVPSGRMTDRYTIWAASVSRAASGSDPADGTSASNGTDAPADSMWSGQGASPGSVPSATGDAAVDQPQILSREKVVSRSAGSDLAMSRLQTATGGSPSAARAAETPPDAAARDAAGIEAGEAALDEAVDRFLVSAQAVDASIGGAERPGDAGVGIRSKPDETGDDASGVKGTPAGLAGLLDDLSGHATTLPEQATPANVSDETQGSGRPDHVSKRRDPLSPEDQERMPETAEHIAGTANDAGTALRDTGSNNAEAFLDGGESARDDIGGVATDSATGADAAATSEVDRDRAGDRLEPGVDDVEETSKAAADEIAGTIAGSAGELRHHLTESSRDPQSLGRQSVGETRTVGEETVGSLRSTLPERADSLAGTGQATAGSVTDRVGQPAQSVTEAVSAAGSRVVGSVRDDSGGILPSTEDHRPPYSRLIVSAVALGTVSGFNRWAVRRLTGADIALLGPATVHPAILGTGLATLLASLYLNDNQSS